MRIPLWLAATIALMAVAVVFVALNRQAARHVRELAGLQQAWTAEKAELEAAVEQARSRNREGTVPALSTSVLQGPQPGLSPDEIIVRLKKLGGSGEGSAARTRQAIYWLEQLTQLGTASLPAIARFLASNEEVEFDTSWFQGRASREGRLPQEQVAPVSLRLALMDVAGKIGGAEAETLLAATLSAASRGVEVAWVNRSLYELAGNAYREAATTVARNLLAGADPNSSSALDRYHREYLFAVLTFYGDMGYASEAQNQLVRMDNQIDPGALRYLQQTLGAQAVPLIAETYRNPALATNSAAKEPLARLALSFVGADASANDFWAQAVNDPALTKDHRRNLIEDLNEDGFADFRNLTASDLPLIHARMALIEHLVPSAMDKVNAEAFAEAYKDLVNMRAKITGQPPAARP